MKEFKEWIKSVKDFIEKRIGKFGHVWVDDFSYPDSKTIDVGITFPEGQMFWMSFDKIEFVRNNKKQRRSLAKYRRHDLRAQIKDFADNLIKTANALK